MPKTKLQGVVFGLLMSYSMALGMEVYNTAIRLGFSLEPGGLSNMTYAVLPPALLECAYMGAIVFLISNLWGNRLGGAIAKRHCDPARDPAYYCVLMRQSGTVAVMCPSMSLVAALLFSVILGGRPFTNLPVAWLGTVLKNFPMAYFWNRFAAAPFTRWSFGKLFPAAQPFPCVWDGTMV